MTNRYNDPSTSCVQAFRLTEARTNGVAVERNGYDALDRRAWTWDGSATNWFIYDGLHVIADVNATGGLIRSYTYSPGIDNLLAMTIHTNFFVYDGIHVVAEVNSTGGLRRAYTHGPGIDNVLAMTVYTSGTAQTYFYIKDDLGTVHAVVDSTGTNVAERHVYNAWGRILEVRDGSGTLMDQSAIGNRFLWQGREYSWCTGLYYFLARWADPATGRWLSPDLGIPSSIAGAIYGDLDSEKKSGTTGRREQRQIITKRSMPDPYQVQPHELSESELAKRGR